MKSVIKSFFIVLFGIIILGQYNQAKALYSSDEIIKLKNGAKEDLHFDRVIGEVKG